MSHEEFLCVRCARHMKNCCQTTDIYATPGDVERIAGYAGVADFTEFRASADPEYAEQDDDPIWNEHVIRPDGSRRVLRKQSNGDCTFLGPAGCTLTLDVRPLVCRLYPLDYTAAGIREEPAEGCPLELLRPEKDLIATLEMNLDDAAHWHRQLYDEIQMEPTEQSCTLD